MICIKCNYDLEKILTILNELEFTIDTNNVIININTNKEENSLIINKILELDWFHNIIFSGNCNMVFNLKKLKKIKAIVFQNNFLNYSKQTELFPEKNILLLFTFYEKKNILLTIPKNVVNFFGIIEIYDLPCLERLNTLFFFSINESKSEIDIISNILIIFDKNDENLLNIISSQPIDTLIIIDEMYSVESLPNTIKNLHISKYKNLDYLPESLEFLSIIGPKNDFIDFSNIPTGIKKIKVCLDFNNFDLSTLPESVENIFVKIYNEPEDESINLEKFNKLPKNLKKIKIYQNYEIGSGTTIYYDILDKINLIKEKNNMDFKIETITSY